MGSCLSSSSSSSSSTSSPSSSSTMINLDVLVDQYYSSAFYDGLFPNSDEIYAKELHLQEALLSSFTVSTVEINPHPQTHMDIVTCTEQEEPKINHNPQTHMDIATCTEQEEPIEPSIKLCMICMDEKSSSDIFLGTTNCTHSYCSDCIVRYVSIKIEDNLARIKCPDVECKQLLEPYMFQDLIPKDVFERWDKVLCESLILSSEKVYCPFDDCSAMMVVDDEDAKVTETECPSCHRLFCAQCKVTWHVGIGCEKFQRFGNTDNNKKKSNDEEDALLIKMAKSKQWRKCPNCKFYVEKVNGCLHIHCRCGFDFCYGCGSTWDYRHACPVRAIRRVYAWFH